MYCRRSIAYLRKSCISVYRTPPTYVTVGKFLSIVCVKTAWVAIATVRIYLDIFYISIYLSVFRDILTYEEDFRWDSGLLRTEEG